MKKLIKISFLFIALISMTTALKAQKFGYVNSALILSEMPEVKQADANLEDLKKVLQKQYENMVSSFQKKYEELALKEKRGELSPKQIEEESKKLQADEKAIADFEKKTQQQLVDKREELLKPIYDKVNGAIKAVADEGDFQMIFDSSTAILLYAEDGADVSNLVKAKL